MITYMLGKSSNGKFKKLNYDKRRKKIGFLIESI